MVTDTPKYESHPLNTLGNIQHTKCRMQYFHMLSPLVTVTLTIEQRSPKVETFQTLLSYYIFEFCEMPVEIFCTQDRHRHPGPSMVTLTLTGKQYMCVLGGGVGDINIQTLIRKFSTVSGPSSA